MAARSPQDVYARHVSSSRGYPLWTPEPRNQLLSYRPEGLRIGDVGVVAPENGSFDVLFNLCLPKDHRFHEATSLPDDFDPIELNDADVKTVPDAEGPGRLLAVSSVTRADRDSCCALPSSSPSATRYSFNMSSSEGAVLVLPEGAESHDALDSRLFFEQASRHAANWYRFAEETLGRIISHDSIYVITGFHKARSWALTGYQGEQEDSAFSAYFTVEAREGGNTAAGYRWEATRSIDWRAGPNDDRGVPNQAVFIRGFKIALRSVVQAVPQKWIGSQPSQPYLGSDLQIASGDSWLVNVWSSISKTFGVSNEGADQAVEPRPRKDIGVGVEAQRIPNILPVFHPSDIINRYILEKEPSAKVAITHDRVWSSFLGMNLLKPEELVQDEVLTKAVSEWYTIVLRGDVASLQIKGDPHALIGATADDLITTRTAQLSIVSESDYRCIDVTASKPTTADCRLADLYSIPSKFSNPGSTSSQSLRPVKIIAISDFICGFCYLCDKILRDAVEACRDLPIQFDVEFRPFTLVNPSVLPANTNLVVPRNAYITKKFGKEQAEMKLKALREFAQKAGLNVAEDSLICLTTQAHRLSAKAYQDGGPALQSELSTFLFEACLVKGANISDEDVLVDAAVSVGLMSKEEATQFLQSTECLDGVEKMVGAAKAQGINGVPFVIIDGKWAVNGLQPKECFIQIFRKLAQSSIVPVKTKA